MTKLCECNHPKNFHNEVGCGGVVELRTTAIVKHAACDCKSYRPSPPAEPKCKRCGHDKTEHSIGNAEYVEGMPDSSCYWGDDEEVCECRAYRPPATTEVEKTGGTMNIEPIRRRIREIRKLSNEILASEEAKRYGTWTMKAFVHFQIDEDGDECYRITIDECSPTDYDAQGFLAEKLRERGVTEQIEISSEW